MLIIGILAALAAILAVEIFVRPAGDKAIDKACAPVRQAYEDGEKSAAVANAEITARGYGQTCLNTIVAIIVAGAIFVGVVALLAGL